MRTIHIRRIKGIKKNNIHYIYIKTILIITKIKILKKTFKKNTTLILIITRIEVLYKKKHSNVSKKILKYIHPYPKKYKQNKNILFRIFALNESIIIFKTFNVFFTFKSFKTHPYPYPFSQGNFLFSKGKKT